MRGKRSRGIAVPPDSRTAHVALKLDRATGSLEAVDEVKTDHHPIGITSEPTRKAVWVACYGGSILVFDDSRRPVA